MIGSKPVLNINIRTMAILNSKKDCAKKEFKYPYNVPKRGIVPLDKKIKYVDKRNLRFLLIKNLSKISFIQILLIMGYYCIMEWVLEKRVPQLV